MSSGALTELLDRVEAICRSERGGFARLAQDIDEHPQRISEWVGQRHRNPSGGVVLKLQSWANRNKRRVPVDGRKAK